MGDLIGDHFGGKVPDFKTDHKMIQKHAPTTQENVDPDDLTRVLPTFVPVQVSNDTAHRIARCGAGRAREVMEAMTAMSEFQLDYLQRCVCDAVQQMMLSQDVWAWQHRYEQAFARGEVPDPRKS